MLRAQDVSLKDGLWNGDKFPPEVEILGKHTSRRIPFRTGTYISQIAQIGFKDRVRSAISRGRLPRKARPPRRAYLYLRASARGMTDFSKKRKKKDRPGRWGGVVRGNSLFTTGPRGWQTRRGPSIGATPARTISSSQVHRYRHCLSESFFFSSITRLHAAISSPFATRDRSISFGYQSFTVIGLRPMLLHPNLLTFENAVPTFRIADVYVGSQILPFQCPQVFQRSLWNLENVIPSIFPLIFIDQKIDYWYMKTLSLSCTVKLHCEAVSLERNPCFSRSGILIVKLTNYWNCWIASNWQKMII